MTTDSNTLAEVRECFKQAMSLDGTALSGIDERTEAADVAAWDSLAHVRLVLALEERFHVSFGDETVVDLVSVKAILQALAGRA